MHAILRRNIYQIACSWTTPVSVLVYLSAALYGLSFWDTPLYDPDLGFHLLGGAWVAQYGDVPRADFINAFNTSWVDYHWLGQLIIHWAIETGGFPAVQALCGLIGLALGIGIVAIIRIASPGLRPLPTLLVSGVVLTNTYVSVSTRPTSMAVVLLVFTLWSILRFHSKALFILPFITALCANMHVYWILIPGFWALAFCMPRLLPVKGSRKFSVSPLVAWGGFVLLFMAGLISPYGIFNPDSGLHAKLLNFRVVIDVASNPEILKKYVDELRPGIGSFNFQLCWTLFVLCLTLRLYRCSRLRLKVFEILLFFGTFLMFIEARKYSAFFFIGSLPLVTPYIRQVSAQSTFLFRYIQVFGVLVFIAPLVFFWHAWSTTPFRPSVFENSKQELLYQQPIKACTAITKIFPHPQNRILIASHYDYGGWCAWALNAAQLPGPYKLTMDGRTQFVSMSSITDAFNLYLLRGLWKDTLERLKPDAILVTRDQPLGQMLNYLDEWKLRYQDEYFGVFVREHKDL
jgi:hypothetical protein